MRSFRLPPVLVEALDSTSRERCCSKNDLIVDAVISFLETERTGSLRSIMFRLPDREMEMLWNNPVVAQGQLIGDSEYISHWLIEELDRGIPPSIKVKPSSEYLDVPLTPVAFERLRSLPRDRLRGLLRNAVRTKCGENTDDLS